MKIVLSLLPLFMVSCFKDGAAIVNMNRQENLCCPQVLLEDVRSALTALGETQCLPTSETNTSSKTPN